MKLKHSNIDLQNTTNEEIELEIKRLESLQIQASNIDLALKKLLVSSYGVLGNKSFVLFDPEISNTITAIGRDMIQFVSNAINKYFKDKWQNDLKIHKLMNLIVETKINEDVVFYIATDSCFINFQSIIESTNWNGSSVDFITQFYEIRLKEYLDKVFEIYSKKWNVENIQFMKMESISQTGLWLGKNKYILDTIWEQGDINYKSFSNLIIKGGELIQKDTPSFIREKLEETIKFILKQGENLDINKLSILVKKYKNEYKLKNIEELSFNMKINDYNNYVLEDQINIEVIEHCPIHIKASAIYNYLLNKDKRFKTKYNLIKTGSQIKYYYAKSNNKDNVFAFHFNRFPIEFAPEFDYDLMFLKCFINPINKILQIINITPLTDNLVVVDRWF